MANENVQRRVAVLAKIESTYGTDASPTASSDAMLLHGDGLPLQTDTRTEEKQSLRPDFTNDKDLIGRQLNNLTFNTVLQVNGRVSAAPYIDPLLRACGFAVTAGSDSSSSSWVYTPISTSLPSATIYTYLDGYLFKTLGCYGSFNLTMNAGASPDVAWTFQGRYSNPAEQSLPNVTLPPDLKEMVRNANLTIGNYGSAQGLIARSLNIDLAGERGERPDMNSDFGFYGISFRGRRPTMRITMEALDDLDAFNAFTYLNADQNVADASMRDVTFWHGYSPSSKIKVTVKAPQLRNIRWAGDGSRLLETEWKLRNNTADGELQIEFIEALPEP